MLTHPGGPTHTHTHEGMVPTPLTLTGSPRTHTVDGPHTDPDWHHPQHTHAEDGPHTGDPDRQPPHRYTQYSPHSADLDTCSRARTPHTHTGTVPTPLTLTDSP